MLTCGKTFLP